MIRKLALLVVLAGCSDPAVGAKIYATRCARCHGADGHGGLAAAGQPAPRNFHDPAFQSSRHDYELAEVIRLGRASAMPAFGTTLSDSEIDAVVATIRRFGKSP